MPARVCRRPRRYRSPPPGHDRQHAARRSGSLADRAPRGQSPAIPSASPCSAPQTAATPRTSSWRAWPARPDRRPAGKPQLGTATLAHPGPPDCSLAAVPADLAADQAPAIGPPVTVTFVALAAKLLCIRRQHRLNRPSPSLQAQPVEAALEILEPFHHQRRQRQRPCRQRRPLVLRLQYVTFCHGVDLLALGLRFATSSLVAW